MALARVRLALALARASLAGSGGELGLALVGDDGAVAGGVGGVLHQKATIVGQLHVVTVGGARW